MNVDKTDGGVLAHVPFTAHASRGWATQNSGILSNTVQKKGEREPSLHDFSVVLFGPKLAIGQNSPLLSTHDFPISSSKRFFSDKLSFKGFSKIKKLLEHSEFLTYFVKVEIKNF